MIEYILSLSLLICVVLLIRGIFRKTVSPRVIYALWLAVVLRMFMPIALFEVGVTLPEFLQSRQTEQFVQEDKTTDNVQEQISTTIPTNPVENPSYTPDYPTVTTPIVPSTPAVPITPDTEANKVVVPEEPIDDITREPVLVNWNRILDLIWFSGAVIAAVWVLFTAVSYNKHLNKDRRLYKTVCGTKVYVSGCTGVPCIAGLIPSIYITPEAVNSKSETLIIVHEHVHLRHGDHIWSIVRALALIVFWWNPLIWTAAAISKQDAELACDDAISAHLNEDGRLKYANILIDTIPQKHRYAVGLGSAPMKERILMLTKKQKNRGLCIILAIVLSLSAVGCSFVSLKEKSPEDTVESTGDDTQDLNHDEQQADTYNSMDDYIAERMAQKTTVNYYSVSKYNAAPEGHFDDWSATANVTDTKVIHQEKKGEVDGLAEEGVLECWEYWFYVKLDVPADDVMTVDGDFDGWFDMDGNHTVIALRQTDGTYTILWDNALPSDIDFISYRNSYEEAIHDWYVTEYGLDLPLYVQDWADKITTSDGEYIGNQPVHRFDGDGWGIYIPLPAWYQSTDAGENQWLWCSSYLTGSSLLVEAFSDTMETGTPENTQANGTNSFTYYYDNPNGGFWRVTISWTDEGVSSENPNVVIEPQLLKLMAESFIVFDDVNTVSNHTLSTYSLIPSNTAGSIVSLSLPTAWQWDGTNFNEANVRIGVYSDQKRVSLYGALPTLQEFEATLRESTGRVYQMDSPITGKTDTGYSFTGYYGDEEMPKGEMSRRYLFYIATDQGAYELEVWQRLDFDGADFFEETVLPIVQSFAIQQTLPHQAIMEDQSVLYDTLTGKEMLLTDWMKNTEFSVSKYTVIDLDHDAQLETVLWLTRGSNEYVGFLILHSNAGKTYAHLLYYRQFADLKEDGTFHFSGGVANGGIGEIRFEGDDYVINKIVYRESSDNQSVYYYSVRDGKTLTKTEYESFEKAQSNKADPVWYAWPAE